MFTFLTFVYLGRHDIADKHELLAYSFGVENVDRRSVVYKKEFKPDDEELETLRKGDAYDRKLKELQEQMVGLIEFCSVLPFANALVVNSKALAFFVHIY